MSKGFFGDFSKTARSANENRAAHEVASKCRSPNGCIREGTLVVMADGSLRPIENVHSGDYVLAMDPNSSAETSPQLVQTSITTHNAQLVHIGWDADGDGREDGSVSATSEHPFWTMEFGWRQAKTIRPGWHLLSKRGRPVTVSSTAVEEGAVTTHNLDVAVTDSFFVWSNGSAVLVHNAEGEVYLFGHPTNAKGKSQVYLKDKSDGSWIPQFHSDGKPIMGLNREHHFFYDAWMKANWEGVYQSRSKALAEAFPCVELSYLDHAKAHEAGVQWFAQNPRFKRVPSKEEWKQVSLPEMEAVAAHMMQAINLDKAKIDQLKNLAVGFMHRKGFLGGCNKK